MKPFWKFWKTPPSPPSQTIRVTHCLKTIVLEGKEQRIPTGEAEWRIKLNKIGPHGQTLVEITLDHDAHFQRPALAAFYERSTS